MPMAFSYNADLALATDDGRGSFNYREQVNLDHSPILREGADQAIFRNMPAFDLSYRFRVSSLKTSG
jgi:hypothetical protein